MKKLNREKLRLKIEETGLTPFAFAHQYGFSYESVRGWLTGKRNAKISNIQALADILHCTIDDITDFYFVYDPSKVVQLQNDREEIYGLFGCLDQAQRTSILQMAQMLADANSKLLDEEVRE